ncbi:MAG: hypothetical protein EOP92_05140 [Lysobacteraceae bacterium]|nr:MAG: hypothetical protein EOP92_05140 [Xanthomonadaceae bacterium]
MTQRCFCTPLLPALFAALFGALFTTPPASAKDFLDKLARQAVGSAVQALANGVAQQPAQAAPAAARAPYVRAGAQPPRMRLEDGTVFYADYIADYWSRPDAVTRGSTPDLDAPGHIIPRPAKFGSSKKQPEYAALQRKLERVIDRVMEHPALAGVRGASLRWGADFGYDGGRQPLVAKLSLIAYPITLGDQDTTRFPDGTYHTPGEGPVLRITINDPEDIGTRQPSGNYRGMTVLRYGYMFVVPNTDRPLFIDADGMKAVNPRLLDPSRPRSDIQFMTVHVGAAGHTMSNLTHKRVDPVGNTGRLIGVLYNTDWRAILQEANALP